MIIDGVKLYAEADSMNTVCGILISYCKPPNRSAVVFATHALNTAIIGLQEFFLRMSEHHPQGGRGSEEQKRYNLTRRHIRVIGQQFRKNLHKQLKKQVWKP